MVFNCEYSYIFDNTHSLYADSPNIIKHSSITKKDSENGCNSGNYPYICSVPPN